MENIVVTISQTIDGDIQVSELDTNTVVLEALHAYKHQLLLSDLEIWKPEDATKVLLIDMAIQDMKNETEKELGVGA